MSATENEAPLMRAMRVRELNAPMTLEDVPRPKPGPGEVRIAVAACGVNFADTLMVAGKYQERHAPPFSPGMEVAGRVDAVGPGVARPAQGDRVIAVVGSGGFAEAVLAPAAGCVPIPEGLSDVEAAAMPVAYGTSHLALEHRAGLKPGERLLVLGAGGGVGLTAVEIGKLMGAEVAAVARGPEKQAAARAKGADHVLDAELAPDALTAQVKALGGADVVYDPVGGAQWGAAIRAANFEARLLPIGFASGDIPQIPANYLLVKNLTVIGLYWGAYAHRAPAVMAASFARLAEWFEAGRLKPQVSDILPLDQANAALELLSARKAVGKVVVRMK